MKKILLINPWGVNNDEFYTSGLTTALNKTQKLDLATNFYYEGSKPNGNYYPIFFKKTEKMSNSIFRKIYRGVEYIRAYQKLLKIIEKEKYDYIHIQWLLMYKVDRIFLKKIKELNVKVVFTAHNALPHVNGEEYVTQLKEIYEIVDVIIVHGNAIKEELLSVFPGLESKIVIQPHGAVLNRKAKPENYTIPVDVAERIQDKELYIMFGNQFFNKGTDRLLKIWKNEYLADTNKMLVIAGRRTNSYPELEEEQKNITQSNNVFIMSGYIEEELLDYLIQKSEAILLPYRHASMSGVVFTAAEYQRMVLTTRSGAICEYLEDGCDSIVVENTDSDFSVGMKKLISLSHEERINRGINLYKNINAKYSWDSIVSILNETVYK